MSRYVWHIEVVLESVDITAVSHSIDRYLAQVIVNLVHYAILAYSNTPSFVSFSLEFANTWRTWVFSQ